MASEIRRTPVLYGEDAKRFLREIEHTERFKSSMSEAELKDLREKALRIWGKYNESKQF